MKKWFGFACTALVLVSACDPEPYNDAALNPAEEWPGKGSRLPQTSAATLLYGFENSTQSWTGLNISGGPWSVTEWKVQGSYGLKADATLAAAKKITLRRVATVNYASYSTLTVVVRHATWGVQGTGMTAKLYVKTGAAFQWFDSGAQSIGSGTAGTTLTLNLASVANKNDIREIGVEFLAGSGSSGSTSLYIDNLNGNTSTTPSLTPVTPNAGTAARNILNKLAGLPSRTENRTLSGQFLGYSGFAFSTSLITTIFNATAQYPAITGIDVANGGDGSRTFLQVFNYADNASLVPHWNAGGLVAVSHHFPNPLRTSGMAGMSATGRETTANIANMLGGPDANNPDKQRWYDGLWQVYLALLDMQNRGITVIYRPLHEMNGDWFWYGGLGTASRPNSQVSDYHALWNSIFTYMTTAKGAGYPALTNLIWVYSPDYSRSGVTGYIVSNRTDIVALDAYLDDPDTNASLLSQYNAMLGLGKPFAFAEIGPNNKRTDGQFDYNRWLNGIRTRYGQTTFFMSWNNFYDTINGSQQLVKIEPTSNLNASGLYNTGNWMLNRGEETLR